MKKVLAFTLSFFVILFVAQTAAAEEPETEAQSVILMEASTGEILYENNPHVSLPPASVTKIMTMLLTMEAIDRGDISYDTVVTASAHAKSMGGSTIFLDTGEEMTVEDLLKGIAVASGNDAAVAMAEHLAGSEPAFVEQMNQRAKELGMNDTNFVNCNGLDADGHYTSAYDIALMSRELLTHEDIFRFTTIWMDSLRDGKFTLSNTNKLIRFYDGANGLKTGSTSGAGCCISATAKRDGMQLIAVVMGAPNSTARFESAKKLLDYGFQNYSVYESQKGTWDIPVEKGTKLTVRAGEREPFCQLVARGEAGQITAEPTYEESLKAPLAKGTQIGEVVYKLGDTELGRVPIVLEEDVNKISVKDAFFGLLTAYLTR